MQLKELLKIKALLLNNTKNIGFVYFEEIPKNVKDAVSSACDVTFLPADVSKSFSEKISKIDSVIFYEKISKTDSTLYKIIKEMLKSSDKEIIAEILAD